MVQDSPECQAEYDKIFRSHSYTEEMPEWLDKAAKKEMEILKSCLDKFMEKKYINERVRVLDLGCGDGIRTKEIIGHLLKKVQPVVTCTDFSQEGLDKIPIDEHVVRKVKEDINSPHWRLDDRYDLIISLGLTPHLDSVAKFMCEIFWASKECIIHFNRNDTILALQMAMEDLKQHGFSYRLYNKRLLNRKLQNVLRLYFPGAEKVGFKYDIYESPVGLIVHTRRG